MNKLNTDLIINILEHLEYSELMRYLDCKAINNKNQLLCNHDNLSDLISDKLDQKQRFIIDNYQNILINSLGGLDNFVKFPFLKFEKKFLNSTAYIDNITTAIFFVAMWLMARRKIESWIFWIIGDLITVPL